MAQLNIITSSEAPSLLFSQFGRISLNNGVATVLTSFAATGMKVLLTPQDINTLGNVRVDNIQPGISFDINSTGNLDSGVIFWAIPLTSGQLTLLTGTLINSAVTINYPFAASNMMVLTTAQDINTNGTLQLNAIIPGESFDIVSTAEGDNGGVVLVAVINPTIVPFTEITQIGSAALSDGLTTVLTTVSAIGLNILASPQDINTVGTIRIDNVVQGTVGASFVFNSTGNIDSGVIAWICVT